MKRAGFSFFERNNIPTMKKIDKILKKNNHEANPFQVIENVNKVKRKKYLTKINPIPEENE